jgi:predicted porin
MKFHQSLAIPGLLLGVGLHPALAQSNVTIYGVVDIFMATTDGGGKNGMTVMDGRGGLYGDRLGFKGSEDLGNGLKALYTLEYSISPDQSSSTAQAIGPARQTWVGLQGNWGTASGGYQYAPGYLVAPRFDPMEGSGLIAPRAPLAVAGDYTISSTSRARWSNSVSYASPSFGGLNVMGIYSLYNNETTDHATDDNRWGLGATYKNGPVDLGLVYHNVGAGTGVDNTQEYYVAGSYDFGMARLMGTWQRKEADGSVTADSSLWSVGVIVPVLKSDTVQVGYARLDPRGDDNNSNSITAGYIHWMSKRTALYGAYNRLHYDDAAPSTPGIEQTVVGGETANTYMAGILHRF